jgi:hypothetical protein
VEEAGKMMRMGTHWKDMQRRDEERTWKSGRRRTRVKASPRLTEVKKKMNKS